MSDTKDIGERYRAFIEAIKGVMYAHRVSRMEPTSDVYMDAAFLHIEFAPIKTGDVLIHEGGIDEGTREITLEDVGVAPPPSPPGQCSKSSAAESSSGLSAHVPNAGTILGYFERGPIRWMLTERKDGILKGVDITPLGKVHTMHMAESAADKLVLINNDDYCLACWNTMPVGETCAVCGRVNKQ